MKTQRSSNLFSPKETSGSRGSGDIEEAKRGEKAEDTVGNQILEVFNIVEKYDQ